MTATGQPTPYQHRQSRKNTSIPIKNNMTTNDTRQYWDHLRENSMTAIAIELGTPLRRAGGSSGKSGMYNSPWRGDNNASLHIDEQKHVWTDFGDTNPSHIRPSRQAEGAKGYASGDTIDFISILVYDKLFKYLSSAEQKDICTRLEGRSPGLFHLSARGALSDYVCHTSRSKGKGDLWLSMGEKEGLRVKDYDLEGNDSLKKEAYKRVMQANETLRRRPDALMDVLARYWPMVDRAEALFCVGRFAPGGAGIIEGGPAWPAQMAIDAGKPVFFYDEISAKWYSFAHTLWEETPTPALTRSFGTACAKNLTEAGIAAIRDCYDQTLKLQGVDIQRRTVRTRATGSEKEAAADLLGFAILAPLPFCVGAHRFPTVEHFIQWTKADMAGNNDLKGEILQVEDPLTARELGRRIPPDAVQGWTNVFRSVVEYALVQAYLSNQDSAYRLLLTGDRSLECLSDAEYPFLGEAMTSLRGFLYESCDGNLSHYQSSRHWVVERITPGVQWAPLKDYMVDIRRVTPDVLNHYCDTVRAHLEHSEGSTAVAEKPVIAVGFPNMGGGYELRKESFITRDGETRDGLKACTAKAPTIVTSTGQVVITCDIPQGSDPKKYIRAEGPEQYAASHDTQACWVFEGFTDFLSALSWLRTVIPPVDCVILNSTVEARTMLPFLKHYNDITCFLDNDPSGRTTTELFRTELERNGITVNDGMSAPAFEGFKDVNEAWQAQFDNGPSASL